VDEQIPFNECAHAYLAAARALLLQLREVLGVDHKTVHAVIGKIEVDMLAKRHVADSVHSDDSVRPDVERRLLPPTRRTIAGLSARGHNTFGRTGRSSVGPTCVWCSKRRTSSGVVSFFE
jgi:hypothetical protein